MGKNKFEWNEKDFKEVQKMVDKLNLSTDQKYKITSSVGEKAIPLIKDETPLDDTGTLKDSFEVKRGSKNKGVSVITNNATNEKDGERYPFILEHSEEKGHQGWFTRVISTTEDEIEDMLLKELTKELGL